MKKATLRVGLQSDQEDWFTSASWAESVSPDRLIEVSRWAFEEGRRRLLSGGWNGERTVTLAVMTHVELTRVFDECEDIPTRYPPDCAREMIDHLFTEALHHVTRRTNDRRRTTAGP